MSLGKKGQGKLGSFEMTGINVFVLILLSIFAIPFNDIESELSKDKNEIISEINNIEVKSTIEGVFELVSDKWHQTLLLMIIFYIGLPIWVIFRFQEFENDITVVV